MPPSKLESLQPIMAYFAGKTDMVDGATAGILSSTRHISDADFATICGELLAEMRENPYQPPVPAAFLMKYSKICSVRDQRLPKQPKPTTPGDAELMSYIGELNDRRLIRMLLVIVRDAKKSHGTSFWVEAERILGAKK